MTDEDPIHAARRARLQAWIDDNYDGKQVRFIAATGINQGELSALLKAKSFGEKKAATLEAQAGMPKGYLVNALDVAEAAQATGIFTRERRASDDVQALQIALESLAYAVLQRVPGSASAFLADAGYVAKKEHFSTDAGFLGQLGDIARAVQNAEAEAARALRRGDSAGNTKRGSRGQGK